MEPTTVTMELSQGEATLIEYLRRRAAAEHFLRSAGGVGHPTLGDAGCFLSYFLSGNGVGGDWLPPTELASPL